MNDEQMSHFVLSNYRFCLQQMGSIITRSFNYADSFTVSKRATRRFYLSDIRLIV